MNACCVSAVAKGIPTGMGANRNILDRMGRGSQSCLIGKVELEEGRSCGCYAPKKIVSSHALCFGYECDQRPFYTRIVVEKHERVADIENKKKMLVACRQYTFYRNYAGWSRVILSLFRVFQIEPLIS